MRVLRFVLIALVIVLIVGVAGVLVVLQDANRFKPQLESLIATHAGVPLEIGGDLQWRLWPPLSLTASELSTEHQGQSWQVERLTLQLDALKLLRDPQQWQVESLTVNDATLRDASGVLEVHTARLEDLAPRQPAPLDAELTYTADGQAPRPVQVSGSLSVDPDSLALTLADTRVQTSDAEGTCRAQAAPVNDPAPAPPAGDEDVIPVELFLSFDWTGECLLDWVQVADRRFEAVTVTLANQSGDSRIDVEAPRFFGGSAVIDLAIDARRNPVTWTVVPTLTGVDSQELLRWLDQRFAWAAPLAYGGTLRFEGNTPEAMLASLSGETHFDGGQGSIDISAVKARLLELAALFNEGERIARWPETWQYQRLVGDWRIERQHHVLDLALDNLQVSAQGDYAAGDDQMDMLVELVFGNDPDWPVFEMNPLLYDVPIPIRCRGAVSSPSCRLDEAAAQRIAARALSGEDSELRAKLEEKIDREVPEEYRDAARSLLDALGGALKRN